MPTINLVTEIPGPRSRQIVARREAAMQSHTGLGLLSVQRTPRATRRPYTTSLPNRHQIELLVMQLRIRAKRDVTSE